jgi:Zn-dependent protease
MSQPQDGGFGAVGRQSSQDCAVDAGTLFGVPIKVSYFLVIYFAGQVFEATKRRSGGGEMGWAIVYAVCGQLILFLTVLVHEFGHGTMAKRLGGEIVRIFLWPFGGICFSTRPQRDWFRDRVKDELKIVVAGPATHVPMAALWLGLVSSLTQSWPISVNFFEFITSPLGGPRPMLHRGHVACARMDIDGCVPSWQTTVFAVALNGVQTNIMLFLFNVFFPMYPMDSAKIIVCTLQLCCKVRYRKVAWILVIISSIAGGLMIAKTAWTQFSNEEASPLGNLPMFLAAMSLLETFKIYQMLKEGKVHEHPLFLGADQEPDSEPLIEEPRLPVLPVSSSGTLGGSGARGAFLDRLEMTAQENRQSVRDWEDARNPNKPRGYQPPVAAEIP